MLNWQKENIQSMLEAQKENETKEKTKLKEKWEKELILDKEKKLKEKKELLNNFKEIEDFNIKELQKKQLLKNLEKQNDKELLNRILEKEKGLDELDKKDKVKLKIFSATRHKFKASCNKIIFRKKESWNFLKIKNTWNSC